MKLSQQTIALLENYAKINPNLTIKQGNVIKTVNAEETVFSRAVITEEFPSVFGIYELKEFLSVLSMFKEPNLNFEGNVLTITDDQDSNLCSRYYSANLKLLTEVKEFPKTNPDPRGNFVLTGKAFKQLSTGSATLSLRNVRFTAKGNELKAVVYGGEKGDSATNNTLSVTLDTNYNGPEFDVHTEISKMSIMSGDYDCELFSNRAIIMRHQSMDLMYVIGLDADIAI